MDSFISWTGTTHIYRLQFDIQLPYKYDLRRIARFFSVRSTLHLMAETMQQHTIVWSKQCHHRLNAFYTSVWYKPQHNLQTSFSWLLNSATPRSCNPRDNKKPLSYSSELYSTPSRLPKSLSGAGGCLPDPGLRFVTRRVFGLPSPDGSRVMAVWSEWCGGDWPSLRLLLIHTCYKVTVPGIGIWELYTM
jgi:hypothetical protein